MLSCPGFDGTEKAMRHRKVSGRGVRPVGECLWAAEVAWWCADVQVERVVLVGGRSGSGDNDQRSFSGSRRMRRTHNCALGERITLAPTVERDRGKRASAQRFLVVPW